MGLAGGGDAGSSAPGMREGGRGSGSRSRVSVPKVRQRTGGEERPLREERVRSCWGWNEEAAEEKAARSQGSRWGIATEQTHVPPAACSQTLRTPRSKEERKRDHGGKRRRGHGEKLIHSLGTFPLPQKPPQGSPPCTPVPRDEGSGMGWGRGPRAGLSGAAPLPNKASVGAFYMPFSLGRSDVTSFPNSGPPRKAPPWGNPPPTPLSHSSPAPGGPSQGVGQRDGEAGSRQRDSRQPREEAGAKAGGLSHLAVP